MRELIYYIAVTLDGMIADKDGDFSAFPAGDHIQAICQEYPETLPAPALEAMGVTPQNHHFDTVLMGWNTYAVGLKEGLASPYPHLRQFVFSRTQTEAADGISLTAGDPVAVVRKLKAEEGKGIWLCGGAQLAGALFHEIDRLFLKVNPIVLGEGIPLFASAALDGQRFALRSSRAFASGVLFNEYHGS